MRRLLALAIAVGLALPVLAERPAQADWTVKRDPFDKRIVARYKNILYRNPADRGALNKLKAMYRRYRSLKLLVRQYEAAHKRRPKVFSHTVVLARLALGQKQTVKAMEYYEKAATIRPKAAAVQLGLGQLYRRNGKSVKARAAYELALKYTKRKSTRKNVLRELAGLALNAKDIKGAGKYYKKLIALAPRSINVRMDYADALRRFKKFKAAIALLKQTEVLARRVPYQRVDVVTKLADIYADNGKHDVAIATYRRAIKMSRNALHVRRTLTSRIIDIFSKKSQLSKLIAYYEKKWRANRRKHFEWSTLAKLYEDTGEQEKAIAAYRRAVKKAPFELETQRKLIRLLENSGREDEALKQYRKVAKVAPGDPRFQLALAERYWRRGEEKRAVSLLKKIEQRFPSDGPVHTSVADLYTRWGKEALALKAYIRLTKIEPNETSHLVNLGEQYFQRKKEKKAIAIWSRLIRRKTAGNYARLGEVFAEHDLLPRAISMYTKSIKLQPKNSARYKGRAHAYERQRRWAESIKDWEMVLALTKKKKSNEPARREGRRRIVSLLRRSTRGRRATALRNRIRVWQRQFNQTPPNMEAGLFLIEAHERLYDYNKQRAVLERLVKLHPKDVGMMLRLVKTYARFSVRQYDKAVALLEKLADKIAPRRKREFYKRIAEIHTINKKDKLALDYMHKAQKENPNDPTGHQRLAELFIKMQQFKKAIKSYEKTIQLDKNNWKAHFALAQLYINEHSPKKAAKLFERVLLDANDNDMLFKAGREAIIIGEMTRTLGKTERVVSRMASKLSHKDVYRRILVELYHRYVPILVSQKRTGTAKARAAARKELTLVGRHGLKPLLEALNDEKDPQQQRIAVAVLGHVANKGAAASLVRIAKQKPNKNKTKNTGRLLPTLDWDVRVAALVAAGRLGDPRTIPSLIELTKHQEWQMREAAIFGLGMTRSSKAKKSLLDALGSSRESLATLACLGFAQVRDRTTLAQLVEVMKNSHRADSTRAACAFALGRLGDKRAIAPLLAVLANGNDEVQRIAAWSLGNIGDRRALSGLLLAYFSRHERLRREVAWALARVSRRKSKATTLAVDLSEYPTKHGKFNGALAIRKLPGTLGSQPIDAAVIIGHEAQLVRGIRDALTRHRDMLVSILGELNARKNRVALGPLTSRVAPKQRRRIEALVDRVAIALLPTLRKLLRHRDAKVRGLSLSVLSKTGGRNVQADLQRGLADRSVSVRRAAMHASATYIRRHGQSAATLIRALAARLRSKNWQERGDAARAMGELGPRADVDGLIKALKDVNGFVRGAAAAALGKLKLRRAVPALILASKDDHAEVRLAVVRGLQGINDSRSRAHLRTMATSDPDKRVRAFAGMRKK